MSRLDTPFPHADIPEDEREPLITAALSAFTRDDPRYRRPLDHDANGLFHGGPEGEKDSLAEPQGFTYCAVSASTPENQRKQAVTYKGRRAAELDQSDEPPRQRFVTTGGRFGRPVKPANSGRKKRAA